MNHVAEDILMHYGTPRHSGRYPWGSGENPFQHSGDFLSRIDELKKNGFSETEIAKVIGLSTTQLRVQQSLAKDERRFIEVETAKSLREQGLSLNQIAERMGYSNDSSVRSLLNTSSEARMKKANDVADIIRAKIDEKGMIDVGKGVERELGVSTEKLNQALYILQREGYEIYGGGVPQVTNPGKQTNIKVIGPPGTEHKDIYDFENVHSIVEYTPLATTENHDAFVYPKSINSDRIKIRYSEEGGLQNDGLVELRRGVEDISLGDSRYAQVRILVDDKRYIKGMAVYSDNLPDGIDILVNSNKPVGTPKLEALKKIEDDPDNPFGSLIKAGGQRYYTDENGKRQLSVINKRAEEGDWTEWKDYLSAQFLSKQNKPLIEKQLNLAIADRVAEFDAIDALENPTVKKVMMKSFADDCDAAAVHLRAAALPRQKYQVILPVSSMKDTEIYAPNYVNGEKVALVRFPHGGTFEIPILTVNNKHTEAKKLLGGNAVDAVGINSKVAEILSGADFDGDTVMVIPISDKVNISHRPPLEGLKGFDPKKSYPYRDGMPLMNNTQTEMGVISNLITDMNLKGASLDKLARAVRHSMVVIDAEKHKLDYKKSEIENGITALKNEFQRNIDEDGNTHHGASTLISRSKSSVNVTKRRGSPEVDKETGVKTWKEAKNINYIDKKGKPAIRTQQSTQMAETDDAYSLSSGTPQENLYANYANKMKALANQSRKVWKNTGKIETSKEAKAKYADEVTSLDSKLNIALKNAPRERQAQVLANSRVDAKKQSHPEMTKSEIKKIKQQELTKARLDVGAKRTPVEITDREWEAIQAGAISENKLYSILTHADIDKVRERATPRATSGLSTAQINKLKAMEASGYTTAQIAEALKVSPSTIIKYVK